MKNIIPIVLASDNNYALFMYIVMVSLLKNKKTTTFYDFYLLIPDDFSEDNTRLIENLKKKEACEIHFLNMKNSFKDLNIMISHITTPTYYRLLLPSLLPKKYQKCIYLDTDVFVCQDLTELYQTDLTDYYVAGVPAISYHLNPENHTKRLSIPDIKSYINTGVLVMNLDLIRKDSLESKFLSLIPKNYHSTDQDIINVACYGKIKLLDIKYNLMTKYGCNLKQLTDFFGMASVETALNTPVIIHYCDKDKPWFNPNLFFAERWWKCARELPCYEKILYNFLFSASHLSTAKTQNNKYQRLFYKISYKLSFGNRRQKLKQKYKNLLES